MASTGKAWAVWQQLKHDTDIRYEEAYLTQPDPIPTGIAPLDDKLGGGMPSGTFTVLAGEAGCGKSAMACVMAYESVMARRMPVFFSMEMPSEMVISRMLSIHTYRVRREQERQGVPEHERMRQVWWSTTRNVVRKRAGGALTDDWQVEAYLEEHGPTDPIIQAWENFRDTVWPWIAVPDNVSTVSSAVEIVDELCEAGIRPFVILDYLQLGTDGDGEGTEYERVTRGSGLLLGLCKRWRIPAVVISSLRNVSRDESKDVPRLSWLRSSGRIGFDAGTVVILKRSGEREGSEQPIEAHVVKNRVGPSGDFATLSFNGGLNRFE